MEENVLYYSHLSNPFTSQVEEATRTCRKIFDEVSWFTVGMFMNLCPGLVMCTQVLPAIIYTTILTTFPVFRSNYIILSPFDITVSAAGLSFRLCILSRTLR